MSSSYTDLKAWQMAINLTLEIYAYTRTFPKEELYGFTAQMRRSAVSIPSNIAEGKGRFSPKELLQFLFTARGSLHELDTQIIIAHQLRYITDPGFDHLCSISQELGKILNGLIHRFQTVAQNRRPAA